MILLSDKDPFGAKAWKEFLTQLAFLTEHKFTIEDVEEAVKDKTVVKKENIALRHCPNCGVVMQLLSVNHDSATQTNDDSKSVWLCRNCFYEKFSTKTVKEEMLCLQD